METLNEAILSAGIVGAGGAGFPTHAKMNQAAKYLIVNAVECEPLLQVDQNLGKKYAKELAKALQHLVEQLDLEKGYIAIKEKYKETIEALGPEIAKYPKLELKKMKSVYPSGDEVVLVYETLGKIVPKGQIPMVHEAIVINLETLFNIYRKIFENKPVTHTYITVTGEVEKPGTYYIPIGTALKEVIELAGGAKIKNTKTIVGGPMTGTLATPFEVAKKTTKAFIVLDENHLLIRKMGDVQINHLTRIMSTCSQCRACTDMCPRHLLGHEVEPHLLMNAMANGLESNGKMATLMTSLGCVNCGICELYACHHDLSPRKMMLKVKQELMANGMKPGMTMSSQKASSQTNLSQSSEMPLKPLYGREFRQVPTSRLVMHLGLTRYDVPMPLIEASFVPTEVCIPLKQHVGAPAIVSVAKGALIKTGQLIAKSDEKALSANIHASISGEVKEITTEFIRIERT